MPLPGICAKKSEFCEPQFFGWTGAVKLGRIEMTLEGEEEEEEV